MDQSSTEDCNSAKLVDYQIIKITASFLFKKNSQGLQFKTYSVKRDHSNKDLNYLAARPQLRPDPTSTVITPQSRQETPK